MAERVKIEIPTSKPDGTLTPDTLTLRQFAEFADALSDLVESMLEVARDRLPADSEEEEPVVTFKEIHNKAASWVLMADRPLVPLFDKVIAALKARNLSDLDPGIAINAQEVHQVSRRYGWNWGMVHGRKRVNVEPTEQLKETRVLFRYPTKLRATIIRLGGDNARVRFRLLNGRAYSCLVDRDFAGQFKLYSDYMLTGDAVADADTLQIIAFKVRDAEPVEEGDLETVLKELAATATPEFISTDTKKFFEAE